MKSRGKQLVHRALRCAAPPSNPHELPETDTHGQIACTDCHSMHEEQTDLQGDAKAYCMSCHHADVFECYTAM